VAYRPIESEKESEHELGRSQQCGEPQEHRTGPDLEPGPGPMMDISVRLNVERSVGLIAGPAWVDMTMNRIVKLSLTRRGRYYKRSRKKSSYVSRLRVGRYHRSSPEVDYRRLIRHSCGCGDAVLVMATSR
jgi:hypothetical protein